MVMLLKEWEDDDKGLARNYVVIFWDESNKFEYEVTHWVQDTQHMHASLACEDKI